MHSNIYSATTGQVKKTLVVKGRLIETENWEYHNTNSHKTHKEGNQSKATNPFPHQDYRK